MLRPRIIPCLLLRDGGLVKTTNFGAARYVGDPVNAIKIFNEKEADELVVLDIDATTQGRLPNERLIKQFAAECRMPLCYGGGIRTVEQARRIIGLGVEKIAISSAAREQTGLIRDVANEVGSQSVVVVLDVRRSPSGAYEVYTHNGTRATGVDPASAAAEAEHLGAGEVLVNSIDREGTMGGYDIELCEAVRRATRLPITFLGGAGSLSDIGKLVRRCGIVGAAAGSLFVFKGSYRAVLITYPNRSQREAVLQDALGS